MHYIRVSLGSESGEPGMTLYEVDDGGWVHRQVQLHSGGTRFAPEDILMCRPVNLDAMSQHPAVEHIDEDEFELLWGELEIAREFFRRVPDPDVSWDGALEYGGRRFNLKWLAHNELPPQGYALVPGYMRLFAFGDTRHARSACAAVFVGRTIEWSRDLTLAA